MIFYDANACAVLEKKAESARKKKKNDEEDERTNESVLGTLHDDDCVCADCEKLHEEYRANGRDDGGRYLSKV